MIGYVMAWHVTLPYWLTAGAAFISLGFAAILPRFGAHSGVASSSDAVSGVPAPAKRLSLRIGFRHAVGSPWLMTLMFQGVVIFVLARVISVNLFQPILAGKGFNVPAYGVVMAVMTFFEAIGSARPGWMRRHFSDIRSVFILSAIMALSVALLPFFGQLGAVGLLCVFSIVTGLSYPIQKQVMNEAIPDPEYRATILSLESLIDRAVTAGVAVVLERIPNQVDGFLMSVGSLSFLMMLAVQFVLYRLGARAGARLVPTSIESGSAS
jgi:predicted MFS family arabinose efflux permease